MEGISAVVGPLPVIRRSERDLYTAEEAGALETPRIAAARIGCPAEVLEQAVRDDEIHLVHRRMLSHWKKHRMVIRCADVDGVVAATGRHRNGLTSSG